MERRIRKPFQGVLNIVRFNWHFYALSLLAVCFIHVIKNYFSSYDFVLSLLLFLIVCPTLVSLVISSYIYDFSVLYRLSWLDDLRGPGTETILNINAGFDETSELLKTRFKDVKLIVADFYDPEKHTEVSIKRARKAYPPFPGTKQVTTDQLPLESRTADKVFAIMSVHEIRSTSERVVLFKEIERVLKVGGEVVVTEHLRDPANFLAYNIGFLHFHSREAWLETFRLSGLRVFAEFKITPFITTFILRKNGTAS